MPIPTDEFIRDARAHLAKVDPALAVADALTPAFPWRVREAGFAAMIRMILGQQVSTASADAHWRKLQEGVGSVTSTHLVRFAPEELKAFGLSGQKASYVLALAEAEQSGLLDFDGLGARSDDEASALLTSIKGIGRWTAEGYLMGSLGRTDIFPAADLALQEGLRIAQGSDKRLSVKALYERADGWRPYRAVAAHLLWAFYSGVKAGRITPTASTGTA